MKEGRWEGERKMECLAEASDPHQEGSPWTQGGEASPFFNRVPRTRVSSRRTAVPLLGSTAPCTQLSLWFP